MITLNSITIYPIKACAGIEVASSQVDKLGLVHDRRFVIVGEKGKALTQRECRSLRQVVPLIDADNLHIQAPGMPDLTIPFNTTGPSVPVRVWNDDCKATDCGQGAAEWFSAFLSQPCRVVHAGETFSRAVNKKYAVGADETAFTDGYPMLLISEASLADLNTRLEQPITMDRFRPNLVIGGCDPYAEDTWREIRLGNLACTIVKPCTRCVVTTIDQKTGESSHEPLRTLAQYRRHPSGGVIFGQNVIHHKTSGEIRVGDAITLM